MGNGIRRSFASAIAVGALVPAGAHAATVGVVETGPFTPTGERSTMTFEGAAKTGDGDVQRRCEVLV